MFFIFLVGFDPEGLPYKFLVFLLKVKNNNNNNNSSSSNNNSSSSNGGPQSLAQAEGVPRIGGERERGTLSLSLYIYICIYVYIYIERERERGPYKSYSLVKTILGPGVARRCLTSTCSDLRLRSWVVVRGAWTGSLNSS